MRRLLASAYRKYSTRIRDASLPQKRSPTGSNSTTSGSAWTARVAAWITSSLSASGAVSSTRRFTCMPTIPSLRQRKVSVTGCDSTTWSEDIRGLMTRHPIRSTSVDSICRSRHDYHRRWLHLSGLSKIWGPFQPTDKTHHQSHAEITKDACACSKIFQVSQNCLCSSLRS